MDPGCESCGRKLEARLTSDFDKHYCIYCQNQQTYELLPFEKVRYKRIKDLVDEEGMLLEEAQKVVEEMLSGLPRWQKKP